MFIFLWFSADSKNSSSNTIRVSNSLDPDQAQHFFRPDMGPNCLQNLSEDELVESCKIGKSHPNGWNFTSSRLSANFVLKFFMIFFMSADFIFIFFFKI